MNKDTFYFSHDYNSRQDEKIKRLIMKHGLLGYGIFWAIVEDLYNNANALQMDYERIAFELRVDESIIISIINDFKLFVFNEDTFGSLSVEKRLNHRNEKSNKARNSANKRWEKTNNDANALQTQSDSNAIKEIKGKEIKGNEIPDFNSFLKYAIKQKPNVDIESIKFKYESWKENNWKDGFGNEIINWKNKLLNTLPHIKEKQNKYDPTNPNQMIY